MSAGSIKNLIGKIRSDEEKFFEGIERGEPSLEMEQKIIEELEELEEELLEHFISSEQFIQNLNEFIEWEEMLAESTEALENNLEEFLNSYETNKTQAEQARNRILNLLNRLEEKRRQINIGNEKKVVETLLNSEKLVEDIESLSELVNDFKKEEVRLEELASEDKEGVRKKLNEIESKLEQIKNAESSLEDLIQKQKNISGQISLDIEELERMNRKAAEKGEMGKQIYHSLDSFLSIFEESNSSGTDLDRRTLIKAGAGFLASSAIDIMENKESSERIQDKIKAVIEDEKKEIKRERGDRSLTVQESRKRGRKVREGNGKVVEEVELPEGLKLRAKIIRTSSKTALAMIEIQNSSEEEKNLDVGIYLDNWEFSTALNITGSSEGVVRRSSLALAPGAHTAVGVDMLKLNQEKERGSVRFEVVGEKENNLELNLPGSIAREGVVRDSGHLEEEIELDYQSQKISEEDYEIDISAINRSGQEMETSLNLGLPSGWSFQSLQNVQSAGGRAASSSHTLQDGGSTSLGATVFKTGIPSHQIAHILFHFFPKETPEKPGFYLIPLDID